MALDERKGQSELWHVFLQWQPGGAGGRERQDHFLDGFLSIWKRFTSPREEEQNIEYDLSYHNWKLVNMIPKDSIFGKPEGLRKQVFFLCGIASLAVLFFLSDLKPEVYEGRSRF